MKALYSMNSIKLIILLAVTVLSALPSRAASHVEVDDNIYNYLQLLRSDFNSAKVQIVNRIMKLSADDAKKFWPIYHDYEQELGKQAINRAEFIAEFVQSNKDGTFGNTRARDMAKRYFKAQRARYDLLKKYHRKIEKALSSIQAAQFLQIENQINIFIDMTIAAEMPLVGESAK